MIRGNGRCPWDLCAPSPNQEVPPPSCCKYCEMLKAGTNHPGDGHRLRWLAAEFALAATQSKECFAGLYDGIKKRHDEDGIMGNEDFRKLIDHRNVTEAQHQECSTFLRTILRSDREGCKVGCHPAVTHPWSTLAYVETCCSIQAF